MTAETPVQRALDGDPQTDVTDLAHMGTDAPDRVGAVLAPDLP